MCEVGCNQIKADSEVEKMPKWVKKIGKELKEGWKRLPKKELCLESCKAFKKDWQQQMCEVGCNQIKADSEATQSINQRGVDLVKSFEGFFFFLFLSSNLIVFTLYLFECSTMSRNSTQLKKIQ